MSITTGRINLDYLTAKHAQKVVSHESVEGMENSVSKALGVLQEHGVYGSFLYLLAKEDNNGKILVTEMIDLLHKAGFLYDEGKKPEKTKDILDHIINTVSNASLQRLLFARELIEQMFIYVRYGEKAKETSPSPSSEPSDAPDAGAAT
jgi:uncharacterized linocin/CFP29 family protein